MGAIKGASEGPRIGAGDARSPSRPSSTLFDLRFQDLTTFLAVRRTASVSAAAREQKVTPSQVSKSLARLESRLGLRLFVRSGHGLELTAAGAEVAPTIEDAVARLHILEQPIEARSPPLVLAAPPYLMEALLPRVVASSPSLRLRLLELPPAALRAYARQDVFDVALLPSAPERITIPWVGTCVGEVRSGLFTTPATARRLGPPPVDAERLRALSFVTPAALPDARFPPVSDDCPLDVPSRTLGHEAQTIGTALRLAAASGQLVFGPRIAAAEHIASGALVEVEVRGWEVCEPLFVACNQDRVLASVRASIVTAALAAFGATGDAPDLSLAAGVARAP